MTLNDFFVAIANLSGLLYVVSSMLAMGMALTTAQIFQPLKNVRIVLLALLVNFILVPLIGYGITRLIPLEQPLQIGLILIATAAGSPFMTKLVQGARGNLALGVGMMVLLMVVSIIYLPIVLPLLLPGVSINPWDIAKSLIFMMLIPLAIGLLFKSHSSEDAAHWQPVMSKISSMAILVLMVVGLGLNISNIISLIGSRGILALVIFVVLSFVVGYFLGGKDQGVRSVMGLGAAQRNMSAAILISGQNFAGTPTLSFVLVAAIISLLILLPTAKRLGNRSKV